MPIYEYRCIPAGHVFEKFESVGEADRARQGYRKDCPYCGRKRRVEQLVSRTGAPVLKRGIGGFHKPNA